MMFEEIVKDIAQEVKSEFYYNEDSDADMVVDIFLDNLFENKEIKNICEKQIPKKPIKKNVGTVVEIILNTCPSCGCEYSTKSRHSHCPDCGQKLDWSSEE